MSMKNLIFLMAGLFLGLNLIAQNTFSTSIDPNGEHTNNNGAVIMDNGDGFVIVSASICDQSTVSCLHLIKTDYNGVPLWSNNFIKYPYGLRGAGRGLIKKQDGNFALFTIENTIGIDGEYHPFLLNIAPNGDSLSAISFGTNVVSVASQSIFECNNNDFVALYTSGVFQQSSQAVLQQVFANGTLGWSKTFAPTNSTNGISLDKMHDDGFALSLFVQNTNDLSEIRANIIRTNAVGDTLWSKWLPNTVDLDYAPLPFIAVQANHPSAAVWAVDTFLYVPGEGLYNRYPPTVFCLSPNGDLLWKHVFVTIGWKTITSLRPAANGDIIGCGFYDGDGSGFMFRLSPTGELLWEHKYYNPINTTNAFMFFDLVETHQGGIAATGIVFTDTEQGGIDNDVGLLLVDANGCISGSCEDTIYLSTSNEGQAWFNLNKPRFVVSPNPVSNQANLLYQLSPNTQQAQLLIHDVWGRELAAYTLSAQEQNFSFDTHLLPNGIYIYSVWANKQRIYTNKFIKQ